MAGRVSCPYDKIDVVFEIVVNPLKRGVDEGYWGVTICGFGTEGTCRAVTSMASCKLLSGRVVFVEWVRVEV